MALRILLADDSQHAQRDGSRILTELGYEVVAVNNGASALQELDQAPFDLVIADTSMPGLTGLEVCERIRQRPEWANLPVLLALAAFELFDAGQGRQAGADDVIQKPFIPSALEQAVQQLLARAGKVPPAPSGPQPGETTEEAAISGAEFPAGGEMPTPPAAPEPEAVPETVVAISTAAQGTEPSAAPATAEATEPADARPDVSAAQAVPPFTFAAAAAADVSAAPSPGLPRWQTAALEVEGGEAALDQNPPAPPPAQKAETKPAVSGPAEATRAPEAEPAPLPGTWLAQIAIEAEALQAPEPEDVLLSAWREAMTVPAPAAAEEYVGLGAALNAVDDVLAQYLAPMIAGEASEQIARRLRSLIR